MKIVVTSKDRHPIAQKDDEKALKSKAFSVQAESAPLPHPRFKRDRDHRDGPHPPLNSLAHSVSHGCGQGREGPRLWVGEVGGTRDLSARG